MAPSKRHEDVVERTLRVCMNTTYAYPLTIKDGDGCYIIDLKGKRYLDFIANVSTANVGYKHPEITGVLDRYAKLGAHKIAGQDFYTEEQLALAEKLLSMCPSRMGKVFFTNSGAEAVENALKMAYRKLGPLPGVSCVGAFHGRTLGALTFTDSKPVHKKNYPSLPRIPIPFITSKDDPELDKLEDRLSGCKVAFIITEAVQGEGGYRVACREFIQKLRQISKSMDVPLIIDEIQAGMGRTGKWWGFQHYDVIPDIMTAAKSLQVGATVADPAYEPKERGAISSTWGGGSRIDLAVGLKMIEIIEKEGLLENAARMGKYLLRRLKELSQRYTSIMNVDGLGLMLKMDLPTHAQQEEVVQQAFRRGLMLLGCGEKSVRLSPPLVISNEEADKCVETMEEVSKELEKKRRAVAPSPQARGRAKGGSL